ncbi:MAG: glycosyltransferase family 39 protein [Armatimonadetes bacterium]|nr:glycosyltransferase family 39 protein [Armatimonadota bacterium]
MIAAALILGVLLWATLALQSRWRGLPLRSLTVALVAIGLACRLAFALLTPDFYAPDEQAHFKYVRHLVEVRTLPVQITQTGAATNDWEYYQPPLYYALLAPACAVVESLFGGGAVLRLLRLVSVLLWLLTVALTLQVLKNLRVEEPLIHTIVLAMVCLLPTYAFLSSVVNNDNLLIAIGSGLLYLLTKGTSIRLSWWVGLLLGVGLLTKLTAGAYVIVVVLLRLLQWRGGSLKPRDALAHCGAALIPAAALWAPWLLRNWHVYGSLTAEEVANVPRLWPSLAVALASTYVVLRETFWTAAGIHNEILFFPRVGVGLGYLGVLGLLRNLLLVRKPTWASFVDGNRELLWAMAAAIVVNLALVVRFGVLYGQGQGRFLFPMLIPIALFLGLGLKPLLADGCREDSHVHLAGFLILYLLGFVGHSLGFFATIGPF